MSTLTPPASTPTRCDALLYGTSKSLEQAVAVVLTDAGITATDLDALLGDTSSADLLAELGSRQRLIEVKSASGNASEKLVGHLENHLRNWPAVGQPPIEGGVLVVNHQYRKPPADRSRAVYDRPDFLRNLPAPVISTRELFDWWRLSEWDQIRNAIFPAGSETAEAAADNPPDAAPPARPARGRLWRRAD